MPPSTLYHYADAAGAIGIIRGRKLWASNIAHMNDAHEDLHGVSQVAYFLELRAQGRTGAESDFLRELAAIFRRGPGGSFRYAFCLSEEPDLLSQWRGYTPKGGYSIGFPIKLLQGVASRDGLSLSPCIYDDAAQRSAIAATLGGLLDSYENWSIDAAEVSVRTRALLSASESLRSVLKHPSFAEEREWRLHGAVSAIDPRCKWRPAGPYIRPYVELDLLDQAMPLTKNPMTEVRIGPGLDRKRAMDALSHLFSGLSLPSPNISCSASPFRH
jgi:hypothetical protein